tara:strand:- start:1901 stop:2866 length:966 start_codon:yes stop_codon:yes gene_type:complete
MELKYFGLLTEEMYNTLNDDEMFHFLNENGVIESYIPATFIKKRKTNQKNGFEWVIRFYLEDKENRFSNRLFKEMYSFIKSFIKDSIETNLLMFNKEFDINNYGLSNNKKRKNGLKIFNKLFFELINKESIQIDRNFSNNLGAEKRFKTLKKEQIGLIEKFRNEHAMIDCYLFGYSDYFNRNLLDTKPILLEIYEFENKLKKLLELNKKFSFEEEHTFTPKTVAQKIYEEFAEKFDSLKQIEFIEQQITSQTKVNRSFIVVLFDLFSNELKIPMPSGKDFGIIINKYFRYSFSEIKLNGSEGDKHSNQIKSLKKDWINFTN